ncbi:MAG: trigger factor, partial [Cyanobacteria bacterium J06638_22]
MKVTQEKLPASRVGLQIEVPAELSQRVYDKTLQKFARNANIPGFRKGKVPTKIITSQYGRQLRLAALEELVEDSIKQAIEQEKIDSLGNIALVSPFEDLIAQYQPGAALTISASVDVPPEASLKQYTGLTIQAEEVPYRTEQVDEVLESYRDRRATRVPVEGRPAQEKDLVLVDFKGIIAGETDDEGNPREVPGGSATDFEVELSEGRFIPGFIDGIIGMNAGETKDVSATFPEDYPQEDVAGKEAVFTVDLKEIKEKELPELDDD